METIEELKELIKNLTDENKALKQERNRIYDRHRDAITAMSDEHFSETVLSLTDVLKVRVNIKDEFGKTNGCGGVSPFTAEEIKAIANKIKDLVNLFDVKKFMKVPDTILEELEWYRSGVKSDNLLFDSTESISIKIGVFEFIVSKGADMTVVCNLENNQTKEVLLTTDNFINGFIKHLSSFSNKLAGVKGSDVPHFAMAPDPYDPARDEIDLSRRLKDRVGEINHLVKEADRFGVNVSFMQEWLGCKNKPLHIDISKTQKL